MINILLVLGTARKGRQSEKVYNFVRSILESRGDISLSCVDVRDYEQYRTEGLSEEKIKIWRKKVNEANGLVIISPEYNHGYPGELKMLLDNAYKEYNGKPVGFCGVSDGPLGGARAVEQLKLVMSAAQIIPINAAVYFAKILDLFDKNGKIIDGDYYEKRVNGMVDEIIKYSK